MDGISSYPGKDYVIGSIDDIGYLNEVLRVPDMRENYIGGGLIMDLASKLEHCKDCGRVLNDGGAKHCENDCFLEVLGFDMRNANAVGGAAVISKMSELLYQMAKECSELQERKREIQEETEKMDEKLSDLQDKENEIKSREQVLSKGKEELQKEKAEFKEKKSKLGRKSNFGPRSLVYHELWVKANPKPTYDELANRLKVSRRTVIRDIQDLRKELEEQALMDSI